MAKRDRVNLEANERLDLGDLRALQLNGRTALRRALKQLIFGDETVSPYSTAQNAIQTVWTLTASTSQVTIGQGRGWVGEHLADASVDYGEAVGEDGDTTQTLDFTGEPAGAYEIFVKVAYDLGEVGSRVYWNPSTEVEQAQSLDTREVQGWKAQYSSTGAPGNGWLKIGSTSWNGAAHSTTAASGLWLYEGSLNGLTGVVSGEWGDGANDRDNDRRLYGVQSLLGFASAVRRQIKDAIGGASWAAAIPQTAVVVPGTAVNLTTARDHIDTITDPHTASPTWTGTLKSEGVLHSTGTTQLDGAVELTDALVLDIAGGASLPELTDTGSSSTGYLALSEIAPYAFHYTENADNIAHPTPHEGAVIQHNNGTGAIWGYLDMRSVVRGTEKAADGPYLLSGGVYGVSNANGGTIFIKLVRSSAFGAVTTLLGSWEIYDTDFSGSGSLVPLNTLNGGTDITALSLSQRTFVWPYRYTLMVKLSKPGGGVGLEFHGITLSMKHRYIHP